VGADPFSWRNPRFTHADALTGTRPIMLPSLCYALGRPRLPEPSRHAADNARTLQRLRRLPHPPAAPASGPTADA
jgi:hypothetical protein